MTSHSDRTGVRGWIGALFATLLLSACGTGGDRAPSPRDDPSPTPSGVDTVEADAPVVAAYTAWLTALEQRDARATCARHAPELTIELRQRAILQQRAELGDPCTGFVAILWEDPARQVDPVTIEATQVTDEDATLAVEFAGIEETVTMVRRNGGWYVADTTPRTSGTADTTRWVEQWCDLEVGLTRDAVVDAMGAPSGEYTLENGGEPQLYWAQDQYDFRAYLDLQGEVLDLVGDYDRLSASDRRILTCPELR